MPSQADHMVALSHQVERLLQAHGAVTLEYNKKCEEIAAAMADIEGEMDRGLLTMIIAVGAHRGMEIKGKLAEISREARLIRSLATQSRTRGLTLNAKMQSARRSLLVMIAKINDI